MSSRKAGEYILSVISKFLENKLKVEEYGSAAVGEKISRVQSDNGKPELISESDDRCTEARAVWLDKLLQTDGSQGNTGGTEWLDQTEAALPAMEAKEETVGPGENAEKGRSEA